MIENLPDELYQWESEYEKDAKKMYLKDIMQNKKNSELYTNDKKTKYSSRPSDILKSAQKFYEKLYTKR